MKRSDECQPGPGTACSRCNQRKVKCVRSGGVRKTKGSSQRAQEEMEDRPPGVAGPSRAPQVGGRKRGREDSLGEDGQSGGGKRCRRDLEQRQVVEAEKAAAWSTYSSLTWLIAGLDAEIARVEKELDR
jgi:hypothetical protein